MTNGVSPTKEGIEALSISIDRDPSFHARVTEDIQIKNPELFKFLQTRVRQLFGENTDAARSSIALVAEINWLTDHQQFSRDMERTLGLRTETTDED